MTVRAETPYVPSTHGHIQTWRDADGYDLEQSERADELGFSFHGSALPDDYPRLVRPVRGLRCKLPPTGRVVVSPPGGAANSPSKTRGARRSPGAS